MPHLLVDISSHGYGHISLTAPVLNALLHRMPELRLTIRCAAPRELLAARIAGEFEHIQRATDFGMVMENAMVVSVEQGAAAYREFHHNWQGKVAREAAELAALKPDLLLSNISYLALAAAKRADIPAVALCSLNWADIYLPYCAKQPEADEIYGQMLEAYASAMAFLKPLPSMPMPALANGRYIGPIALLGKNRRAEINSQLGLKSDYKLVLASLGGIKTRLPVEDWPRLPGVRWLVQSYWQANHPDVFELEKLGMSFIDLVCSCDALLTKPGYGTFAEAGCNGIPLLYIPRGDWPEEPYLVEWLKTHGRCLEVENHALQRGDLGEALQELFSVTPAPVPATGAGEAAAAIAAYFN
jgi:UDP:flavonoid glycosyltransferase YjiC (YdhE family)